MIITIDGPAGTGKSTVARELARRLGFRYLDTGAMYRAVGLACLRAGVDPQEPQAAADLAARVEIVVDGRRTWLNGLDVTDDIRSPEATAAASVVAENPAVRARLVELQQRMASQGNYVCEGRDQGTVVFPHADVKFYLTAAPEIRAERRRLELAARGELVPLEVLLAQQEERDRRDQERTVAPLRPADDAVPIDTSRLTTQEVVAEMERHIHSRRGRDG
jgi:cytidylate kinase